MPDPSGSLDDGALKDVQPARHLTESSVKAAANPSTGITPPKDCPGDVILTESSWAVCQGPVASRTASGGNSNWAPGGTMLAAKSPFLPGSGNRDLRLLARGKWCHHDNYDFGAMIAAFEHDARKIEIGSGHVGGVAYRDRFRTALRIRRSQQPPAAREGAWSFGGRHNGWL